MYRTEDALRLATEGNWEGFENLLACDPSLADRLLNDGQSNHFEYSARLSLECFDVELAERFPEACIKVTYDNWFTSTGKGDRADVRLVTQTRLDEWLQDRRDHAWDECCQGYGDGTIDYLNIEIQYPDGRVEKIS